MESKKVKLNTLWKWSDLIERLPSNLRFAIIDFCPIFVAYHFDSRRLGNLLFVRFRYDRFFYELRTPSNSFDNTIYKSSTRVLLPANNIAPDILVFKPELDEDALFKALTKNLFCYFKSDENRVVYPLFRHFFTIGNIIDISNLYKFLPKRSFLTLYLDNPYLRSKHTLQPTQIIDSQELNLEISTGMFSDDMTSDERAKNFNLVIDRIPNNRLRQFRMYPCNDERLSSQFDLFRDLHLEKFKGSLMKLRLESTSFSQFHEALEYFHNLFSLFISLEVEPKKTTDFQSSVFEKMKHFEIGGSLLGDDNLESISKIFPNLKFLNLSQLESSKVTSSGITKFFSLASFRNLRSVKFTSSKLKKFKKSEYENIAVQENLESLLFHNQNDTLDISLSNLSFLHRLAPNATKLDIILVSDEKEFRFLSRFEKLRSLRIRSAQKFDETSNEGVFNKNAYTAGPTRRVSRPSRDLLLGKLSEHYPAIQQIEELDFYGNSAMDVCFAKYLLLEKFSIQKLTFRFDLENPHATAIALGFVVGSLLKEVNNGIEGEKARWNSTTHIRLFFCHEDYYTPNSENVVSGIKALIGKDLIDGIKEQSFARDETFHRLYEKVNTRYERRKDLSVKEQERLCRKLKPLFPILKRLEIGVCDSQLDITECNAPLFIWSRELGLVLE